MNRQDNTPTDTYGLQLVKDFIAAHTGIRYYDKREQEFLGKVSISMKKHGVTSFQTYLNSLQSAEGRNILDDLISTLTIGETYFFRESDVLNDLSEVVIPSIIRKNSQTKKIRIWSAGCATGEEAYTLSIMLKRAIGPQLTDWDISIIGSDINRSFLIKAREGIYREWSFREISAEMTADCFEKKGEMYHLSNHYKKGVSFQYHNLVTTPVPSLLHNLANFDLIFCRNVMIYFDKQTNDRLIDQLRASLVDDGWLVVGYADHFPGAYEKFSLIQTPKAIFYQNAPYNPISGDFAYPPLPKKIGPQPVPQAAKFSGGISLKPPLASKQNVSTAVNSKTGDYHQKQLAAIADLVNKGELNQAHEMCCDCMHEDNLNEAVHFYYGIVLEQLGKFSDAEDAFKKAIYLNRSYVLAHYHLGMFYQNRHKYQPALKAFKNAHALLSKTQESHIYTEADGLSAGQLKELTEFHIEILDKG